MSTQSIIETRRYQMFPTLEPEEIKRLRRFGEVRSYGMGEALAKVGEVGHGLTVILAGTVDIIQHDESGRREPIVTHGPGSFMGELAQLGGRPALVDAYAQEPVTAVIIPPERLRALLVAEAELGERIMRALILRRVDLLETGAGGPVIVGRAENGDVIRLEGFLSRNGHPHQRLNPDTDPEAKALVERFRVEAGQLPIVLCPGGQLLHNPSETELARCIGLVGPIDPDRVYDVAIVGGRTGGPRRRGLWGVRRAFRLGAGMQGVRRPGRSLGADRELPRLPDGDHRHGPDGAGLQPGSEVWSRDGDSR